MISSDSSSSDPLLLKHLDFVKASGVREGNYVWCVLDFKYKVLDVIDHNDEYQNISNRLAELFNSNLSNVILHYRLNRTLTRAQTEGSVWNGAPALVTFTKFKDPQSDLPDDISNNNTDNTNNITDSTSNNNTDSTSNNNTDSTSNNNTDSTSNNNTDSTSNNNTDSTSNNNTDSTSNNNTDSTSNNTINNNTTTDNHTSVTTDIPTSDSTTNPFTTCCLGSDGVYYLPSAEHLLLGVLQCHQWTALAHVLHVDGTVVGIFTGGSRPWPFSLQPLSDVFTSAFEVVRDLTYESQLDYTRVVFHAERILRVFKNTTWSSWKSLALKILSNGWFFPRTLSFTSVKRFAQGHNRCYAPYDFECFVSMNTAAEIDPFVDCLGIMFRDRYVSPCIISFRMFTRGTAVDTNRKTCSHFCPLFVSQTHWYRSGAYMFYNAFEEYSKNLKACLHILWNQQPLLERYANLLDDLLRVYEVTKCFTKHEPYIEQCATIVKSADRCAQLQAGKHLEKKRKMEEEADELRKRLNVYRHQLFTRTPIVYID